MPKPTIVDLTTLFNAEIIQPLCDLAWDVFGSDTEDRPVNTVDEAREKLKAVEKDYVDGKVAEVTNTASIGLTGYWECKKTGLLVQWGNVQGNGTRLDYPIAFSTTPWLMVAPVDSGFNDYLINAGTTTRSATGFNALVLVRTGSVSTSIWVPNANASIQWLALGRRA